MDKVTAVVLAAGRSSRYGRNKLLVEAGGTPLVRKAVGTLVRAGLTDIVVVLGHDPESVRSALQGCDVRMTVNPSPDRGMASSIAVGVGATEAGSAVLIVLADMAWMEAQTVKALVSEYLARRDPHAIVVPASEGRTGNPVLFGPVYRGALETLDGDVGARSILEANLTHVTTLQVGAQELEDVDEPLAATDGR